MPFRAFEKLVNLTRESIEAFKNQIEKDGNLYKVKLQYRFETLECKAKRKELEEFLIIVKENLEITEVPLKCGDTIFLLTYVPLIKRWIVADIKKLGGG
jgi:hypothetical protein